MRHRSGEINQITAYGPGRFHSRNCLIGLLREGAIEKVRRGVYRLRDGSPTERNFVTRYEKRRGGRKLIS
jgi:hypothetical protein